MDVFMDKDIRLNTSEESWGATIEIESFTESAQVSTCTANFRVNTRLCWVLQPHLANAPYVLS